MKRIPFLLLFALFTSILISSCSDTETYAQQLKAEKTLIAKYIKLKKIKVISKVPANNIWGADEYLLTSDGLYINLVDSGSGAKLISGDEIVPRYKEFTLDVADTTVNNWSTVQYPNPVAFTYLNTAGSCVAFHEAASYMKRNGAIANLIIPSKIGFYSTDLTAATPYGYVLKIRVQKQ